MMVDYVEIVIMVVIKVCLVYMWLDKFRFFKGLVFLDGSFDVLCKFIFWVFCIGIGVDIVLFGLRYCFFFGGGEVFLGLFYFILFGFYKWCL